MVEIFELYVALSGDRKHWTDSHRFPVRPDIETVKSLLDRACDDFVQLYDEEPEHSTVQLSYVPIEDQMAETFTGERL